MPCDAQDQKAFFKSQWKPTRAIKEAENWIYIHKTHDDNVSANVAVGRNTGNISTQSF